ncbi:GTP cyclohydrolase I FolE2 [Pseudodesulfovibrio sp. JC047]|uniref:GTP cyclohydrolase MptA n=1 Tax=Pseudodesulfovibrio sp. JC047 TaxID=2683199 RepID=UPI0013D813E2|nr:GTP cyclohydrolase MptA [Pseudodesulfovibrio sp. JC047]NDV19451.1 GTP cyclohydrolase I FolE2 [Pseudodesulfovibrio sp. JC047]
MGGQHTAYLGLGANQGNRLANLLQALQYMRARMTIEKTSSYYETDPVGYEDQPDFINMACQVKTELAPQELLSFLKRIEKRMGRKKTFRNGPRPIDIDILFYDDLILEAEGLSIPHPRVHERAFVLVPLVEIEPGLIHTTLDESVETLLGRLKDWGVTKKSILPPPAHDVQQEKPSVPVSLSRVGVTNVQRNIQLGNGGGAELFQASLDLYADLDAEQAGVHMSRFSQATEELVHNLTLVPTPNIESLAGNLSRQVLVDQGALRSEVRITARSSIGKVTPVSGKFTEELYTLIGTASSTAERTRCLVGVSVEGMTVCPCAQDMVRINSREILLQEGFTEEQADRILDAIPVASHNQRGLGTLMIGTDVQVRAESLVHILEAAMSSETYTLLKRPDEFFVVNKAHRHPRFVEDVVREVLRLLVDSFPDLSDDSFVFVRQENLESIHKHNACAERYGLLGGIRRELEGEPLDPASCLTMDEWLKS